MPIQNTKFVMPQAQPTGMLLPQTPTPVNRRYRMQNVPKAAKEPVMPMVIHHQSGALFSTIPEIRSEIHAIEWLFRTSGRLGIRSTKATVDASASAIRHFLHPFRFLPAVHGVSDRRAHLR